MGSKTYVSLLPGNTTGPVSMCGLYSPDTYLYAVLFSAMLYNQFHNCIYASHGVQWSRVTVALPGRDECQLKIREQGREKTQANIIGVERYVSISSESRIVGENTSRDCYKKPHRPRTMLRPFNADIFIEILLEL